ncbi:MAG: TetR/AcrR family transcriptional regulator [Desulfobacteraceae bacterium]|nr:MAG: TetR/AcrR family transcriptional regulator [Desulfobacteraceae bacterium]
MNKTEKQQEIFQAALKMFARYGFKKTTVEDVAAEVGMTKSNLYFYVANKRDLYEQTVGDALRQWRDSIASAIAEKDDAVDKFSVMASKSFEYLSHHPDLRSILIMDPGIFTLSPEEDRFAEINQGAMLLIKDILVQGVREGVFYEVDVDHISELLFSIYIMFLIKTYIKSEGISAFRMYEEGLALILRGLCRKEL